MSLDAELKHNFASELAQLDFVDRSEQNDLSESGDEPEPLGSSFRSLLQQNEELAARLRVSLQRLSQLEKRNQYLNDKVSRFETEACSFEDQILVWREKDKFWSQKEALFERKLQDKIREFEIERSLLHQKANQVELLEERLTRFEKYHEKVKTTVKPYVHHLKMTNDSLQKQNKELYQSLLSAESLGEAQERRLRDLKIESESTWSRAQHEKNDLIEMFERERTSVKAELESLRDHLLSAEGRAQQLNRCLERQDELENTVIGLRRAKDEERAYFEAEIERIRIDGKTALETGIQLKLTNEQLALENSRLKESGQASQILEKQNKEQLMSLRHQWVQTSQENENLKISLRSLEKLNADLSRKINDLRRERSPEEVPVRSP